MRCEAFVLCNCRRVPDLVEHAPFPRLPNIPRDQAAPALCRRHPIPGINPPQCHGRSFHRHGAVAVILAGREGCSEPPWQRHRLAEDGEQFRCFGHRGRRCHDLVGGGASFCPPSRGTRQAQARKKYLVFGGTFVCQSCLAPSMSVIRRRMPSTWRSNCLLQSNTKQTCQTRLGRGGRSLACPKVTGSHIERPYVNAPVSSRTHLLLGRASLTVRTCALLGTASNNTRAKHLIGPTGSHESHQNHVEDSSPITTVTEASNMATTDLAGNKLQAVSPLVRFSHSQHKRKAKPVMRRSGTPRP